MSDRFPGNINVSSLGEMAPSQACLLLRQSPRVKYPNVHPFSWVFQFWAGLFEGKEGYTVEVIFSIRLIGIPSFKKSYQTFFENIG